MTQDDEQPEPGVSHLTAPEVPPRRPHIIRRLYDWVLHWADTPYGTPALFLLAFAEASFFPVPPDLLLIALVLGCPKRWRRYALVCLVGSVTGGMAGYVIGHEFFPVVNRIVAWIVGNDTWYGVAGDGAEAVRLSGYDFFRYAADSPHVGDGSVFLLVKDRFDTNAFLAIFTAGFTPIPYKVFTIAAGYFQVDFGVFTIASILSRGARFFGVAVLLWRFGPPFKRIIDKYFNLATLIFMVLFILSFVVLKYLLH